MLPHLLNFARGLHLLTGALLLSWAYSVPSVPSLIEIPSGRLDNRSTHVNIDSCEFVREFELSGIHNGEVLWSVAQAQTELEQFLHVFVTDKMWCGECFGNSAEGCRKQYGGELPPGCSDVPHRKAAHRSLGKDSDDQDFIVQAFSLYAMKSDPGQQFYCGIHQASCQQTPPCESLRKPSQYLIWKSFTHLNRMGTFMYDALDAAVGDNTIMLEEFDRVFTLPKKKDHKALMWTFLNFFMSTLSIATLPVTGGTSIAGLAAAEGALTVGQVAARTAEVTQQGQRMMNAIDIKMSPTQMSSFMLFWQTMGATSISIADKETHSEPPAAEQRGPERLLELATRGRAIFSDTVKNLMTNGYINGKMITDESEAKQSDLALLFKDGAWVSEPTIDFSVLRTHFEKTLYMGMAKAYWSGGNPDTPVAYVT